MRNQFTSIVLLSSCILLISSLVIAAKLNTHKHVVISRIAKNAKAMGVSDKVVDCLSRELTRFEQKWTPNSERDLITKAHYEEVANKKLSFCSMFDARWKENKSNGNVVSGTLRKAAGMQKLPIRQQYCGACYSGCHFCCIQNGAAGLDRCWLMWCGGNGQCY